MIDDAYRATTTEARLNAPLNGTIYTTARYVATEYPIPLVGENASSALGPEWLDSVTISVSKTPVEGQGKMLTLVHARIPPLAVQLQNNWEYSTCSIGGQQFPSVQRTFVLKQSEVADDSPAPGSEMPLEPGSIFTGENYVLVERQVVNSGMELEPAFRVERRNYVKRSTTRQISVDPLNGLPLLATTDLYHASEMIYSMLDKDDNEIKKSTSEIFISPPGDFFGLQANGWQRSGQQLSCSWYSIVNEQVIAGLLGAGSLGSYDSTENFSWPPVLKDFGLLDWPRRDGGIDVYPQFSFEPDAYDGPCECKVERWWSRTEHVIPAIKQLQPTPVHFASPLFTLSIPACLHGTVTAQCNFGTADPTYDWTTDKHRIFDPTKYGTANQTTWPDSIVAWDDQEPFRGGYLRTRKTIYKPNTA